MRQIGPSIRTLSLVLILIALSLLFHHSSSAQTAEDPLNALQARVADIGHYDFRADVEQTLIPRANPTTIGQGSERIDVRVTGQVDLPDRAEFAMRFEGAGSSASTLTIEQIGSKTTLIFDLTGYNLSYRADEIALLIDDDGDFSDARRFAGSVTLSWPILQFDGVDVEDGDYLTLALQHDKTLSVVNNGNGTVTSDPAGNKLETERFALSISAGVEIYIPWIREP
ncbi:MAG: hypothetical protein AAF633_09010 [Chloroflexota bacterium]